MFQDNMDISANFLYIQDSSKMFTATRSHQNCYIECNCSRIGATGVTINVLQRETTTTSTTAAVHYIASTTSLASYSKEQMTDGKTHNSVRTGIVMSSNDNYIVDVIVFEIVAIGQYLLIDTVSLCVSDLPRINNTKLRISTSLARVRSFDCFYFSNN